MITNLAAVGVGASVGHRENTGAGVLELEVLIGKLVAVDGLATSAVVVLSQNKMSAKKGSNNNNEARLFRVLVKSPPWAMNPGMTRWKVQFL